MIPVAIAAIINLVLGLRVVWRSIRAVCAAIANAAPGRARARIRAPRAYARASVKQLGREGQLERLRRLVDEVHVSQARMHAAHVRAEASVGAAEFGVARLRRQLRNLAFEQDFQCERSGDRAVAEAPFSFIRA